MLYRKAGFFAFLKLFYTSIPGILCAVYFNYCIIMAKVIVYNTRVAKKIIFFTDRSLAAKLCETVLSIQHCAGVRWFKKCQDLHVRYKI